jgi:hypothetical protein
VAAVGHFLEIVDAGEDFAIGTLYFIYIKFYCIDFMFM